MIKNCLLIIVLFLFCDFSNAQIQFSDKKVYKIVYTTSFNNKVTNEDNKTVVFSDNNQTLVTNEKILREDFTYPFEISVVDRKNNVQNLIAFLKNQEVVASRDSAIRKQQFELLPETKKILGYTCKKAKTIINSNTIELWYTDALPIKGAPSILGQNLGLVLEMVRNGNTVTTAQKIEKVSPQFPKIFSSKSTSMDILSYRDEIWKSRFTKINLFTDQVINFSEEFTPNPDVLRFANGTVVVKKIKIPEIKKGNSVFLDLTEQSNGDAYDRTGSVFLIPVDKKISFLDALKNGVKELPIYENGNSKKYQGVIATSDYNPVVELMRFFTPFGVKHFNNLQLKGKEWENSVLYRQDITDFSSLLSEKEVYIGVFIGNYDKGGHKINANLTIHPEEFSKSFSTVVPLFNTLNVMEMAGQDYGTMFDNENGLKMNFTLKNPIKNAQLKYITTGHGGWGEGDEFVRKTNTIIFNGKTIFSMIPWKEDCGAYREYNPASGNFGNGLSSSDLSRSNWCPATSTNPYIIPLGDLEAGNHSIQVKIPQGAPEGTSFNAWNVSGVIVGN